MIEDLADAIKSGHMQQLTCSLKNQKQMVKNSTSRLRQRDFNASRWWFNEQANIGLEVAEKFVAYSDRHFLQ